MKNYCEVLILIEGNDITGGYKEVLIMNLSCLLKLCDNIYTCDAFYWSCFCLIIILYQSCNFMASIFYYYHYYHYYYYYYIIIIIIIKYYL